jgi:DNA replication protein DnaC
MCRDDLLQEQLAKRDLRVAPLGYHDASWSGVSDECLLRLPEAVRKKEWPLYLHGGTGVGKTSIAALLYRRMKTQPMWFRADDFLLTLATGRTAREPMSVETIDEDGGIVRKLVTFAQFQRHIGSTSCVFLDDLGVRRDPSSSMRSYLFDLFEQRIRKPLVITSNLSPEELADIYDDRIISRIKRGTVLHVRGADRREGRGKRFLV